MGSKNKTHLFVVNKKPTLSIKTLIVLKAKEWRKMCHANTNQKEVGIAVLISDTVDFTVRVVIKDKEEHHTMIKGSIL